MSEPATAVRVVRHTLRLDVTAGVTAAGDWHVSALAAVCEAVTPRWLLFCVPGGSYGATYWDFQVPGRSGYSFAEYFARRGAVVVAVDNLGTGASSRPEPPVEVGIDLVAAANADALAAVRSLLKEGGLIPRLGPADPPAVGVGHSLGGFAVLRQQEATGAFVALAILGATMQPLNGLPEAAYDRSLTGDEKRRAIGQAVSPSAWGVPYEAAPRYVTLDRAVYGRHFYRDDVPTDVAEADRRSATVIPREAALDVMVPDRWPDVAASVRCPVFLAFGDPDLSPDIEADASMYSRASSVTVMRVPDSAHCHNLAEGRGALWGAMVTWLEGACGEPSREKPR